MRELDCQGHQKIINLQIADQIYKSVRESETDICDIAQNLGFKRVRLKLLIKKIWIMHILDVYSIYALSFL